jgi:hypothetical protein
VRLPNDDEVKSGVKVTGGGGYYNLRLLGRVYGQSLADAARPCLDKTRQIALFNPGSDVEIAE